MHEWAARQAQWHAETGATWHPRVAMQILRHSQIAVTMNVYSEVSSEATREALRQLGASLSTPGT